MSKNQDLGELINGIKSLGTNQLNAPAYTSATSFTGTLAGLLGFDSSGNIITTAPASIGVTSFNTRTGAVTLSGSDVTGALGYTPYDTSNPAGYITSAALGGYVPTSRTLTINGVTYDLSANRSWTVSGSSQWTTSGSNIYYNTGNVGIGTSSFSSFGSRLQMIMKGDATSGVSVFQVTSNDLASSVALFSGSNSSDAPAIIYQKDLRFGSVTDNGLTGYTDRMRITSDGKVGIGTTSPVAMLSLPTNTSNSQISTGSIEIQSYAVNNCWLADNMYYNGSGFVARNSGYTHQIYFGGLAGIRFLTGDSVVSAGGAAIPVERMRITYNGTVTIGTSTPYRSGGSGINVGNKAICITTVADSSNGGTHHEFVTLGGSIVGNITTNSSNTTYSTSSDYRLKYDYQDLQALDLIDNLKIYQYKWKVDNAIGYGVMAHELQEYLPYAVTGKKDGDEMQAVDYSKLAPIAIAGVKQLNKLFESHAEKIARLESEVAFLKSNIA